MELKKLSDIDFKVKFKYGLYIEVHFIEPVLSTNLTSFLDRIGFVFKINKIGFTEGLWVTGPDLEGDYKKLRQTFKEYGISLPPLEDVISP